MFQPNFLKYDLIVIPFLPSYPSRHFSLIEAAMEYGVPVFVLNWWQSKSAAEMEYRKTPLELLAKFNIHFHSYSAQYTRYLENLDFAINYLFNSAHL